jgi:hypothetical protein
MPDRESHTGAAAPKEGFRVRLPGFVAEQDVGLGDAVKRATRAVGVKPCTGCERRAQTLNRWVRFGGPRT